MGQRGGVMNAIFGSVKNRAIDGQSNAFDKAFRYKNSLVILKAGCFGNVDDYNFRFLIDHVDSTEVADNNGALELMVDADGIQFRLDLEKTEGGNVIARMCEVGNRSAISVGCDINAEHDEIINGQTVRVVTRAILREISICKAGAAGDDAFAMLVDTTVTPKPVAGSRSTMFNVGRDVHTISRKLAAIKESMAIADLSTRIAAYTDQQPIDWSMTANESNHMQSLHIEQMQNERRNMLGM
jgi:HK97 family phage prohead protease